jgi:uncharacterized Fe-S cluster protein YjdI
MNKEKIVKKYSNGEITIVWKPNLCTHVAYCFMELPEVFDPSNLPWVNANGASTERIIAQVRRCPTGALTFYRNSEVNELQPESGTGDNKSDAGNEHPPVAVRLKIMPHGPILVNGNTIIVHPDGKQETKTEVYSLCRCGHSKKKPYCDGSHAGTAFDQ